MTVVINAVVKTTRTLARRVAQTKWAGSEVVAQSNLTPLTGVAKMAQPLSPMEQLV